MDRDDIIKLMREAGFLVGVSVEHWGDVPFAKLCHPTPTSTALYRMLESLVSRAVAAELRRLALKQWVGLTDDEIQGLSYLSQKIDEGNSPWFDRLGFAKAIEQALKEKNQ